MLQKTEIQEHNHEASEGWVRGSEYALNGSRVNGIEVVSVMRGGYMPPGLILVGPHTDKLTAVDSDALESWLNDRSDLEANPNVLFFRPADAIK